MLLIPESRKRPITDSLLYKQIVRFFEEEKIADRFEIAFITISEGVVSPICHSGGVPIISGRPKNLAALPPTHFRSGALWVKKAQIEQMADSIVRFIKTQEHKNIKTIVAYCRGAYLEAIRLANKKLLITNYKLLITEIFSDDELAQLKKKGIMWMKVGLRMPTAFIIFRMKMRFLVMENESGQLRFNF